MNKCTYIVIFLVATLLTAPAIAAADGYERWRRGLPPLAAQPLTLDLADDYSPAFSRNGKQLIFASNRYGNYDLWQLTLKERKLKQLTDHRAIDRRPAYYPGKKLYFISTRSDAAGDVYSLSSRSRLKTFYSFGRISGRVLKGWTNAAGEEMSVAASPDGEHIAYVGRRDGVSSPTIYFYNTKNGSERPLAKPGAGNPCFSPDGRALIFDAPNAAGGSDIILEDLASGRSITLTSGSGYCLDPSFSPDGEAVYYLRYQQDTNGDGRVDLMDKPAICVYDLVRGNSFRLTPRCWNIFELACGPDGRLYFVSDRAGNLDIWVLDAQGQVPDAPNAACQLRYALAMREPDLKEIAFRKVLRNFPRQRQIGSRALYALAGVLREQGRDNDAAAIYRELVSSRRDWAASGQAAIELLLMQRGIKGSELRKRLRLIGEDYGSREEVAAKVLLELGGSYERVKRPGRALDVYIALSESYPSVPAVSAEAWRRQGVLHERAARVERARACYLHAARDVSATPLTAETAQYRLLVLESAAESGLPSLAGCERIAKLYPELIYLRAQAQLTIGEIYEKLGDREQAVKEYGRLIEKFPGAPRLAGEAAQRAARLAGEEGDAGARIRFLELAAGFCRETGKQEEIRDTLYRLHLTRADARREAREHIQAIKEYRGALRQRPRRVVAYRRMINCYEATGKILEIIGEYEELVDEHPENDLYHYLLGYCYSSPALRAPYYGRAIKELKQALELNPAQTYAYLTLGWIYERLAAREKRNYPWLLKWLVVKPTSFVFNTGYGVFDWMNIAPPRPDDLEPEDWRLQAIELYKTGLAENDAVADPELEVNFLGNIANQYVQLDNLDQAHDYYRKREEYDLPFESVEQEALFHYNAGRAYRKVEEYERAMAHYQVALGFFRQQGRTGYVFDLYNRMGNVAWEQGAYGQVVEYARLALEKNRELKLSGEESRLYRNIAGAYHYRGEELLAIRHARLALAAANRIRSEGLELTEFAVGLTEEVSEAYRGFDEKHTRKLLFTWIGEGYANLRDYEEAINFFQKKLSLYRPKGDQANVYAIILNNIGVFYYYLGQYDKALDHFDRSLELCRELENGEGITINEVNRAAVVATMAYYADANQGWWGRVTPADISRSLAACYTVRRELAEENAARRASLSNLIGCLHIYRAARITPATASAAATLDYLSSRYREMAAALEAFAAALQLAGGREDRRAAAYLNMAGLLLQVGDWEKAEQHLAEANRLCADNRLYNLWWRVERTIGHYHKLRGEKRQALYHYQLALEKVELSPRMLSGQRIKNFLVNDELFVYEDIMLFLIEAGEIEESFDYFERSRDKRVVDLVADYDIDFYQAEDGKYFRDIRDSQRAIVETREQLLDMKQDPFVRRELVKEKVRQLKQEEQRYEDLLLEVYNVRRDLSTLFTIHPDITADVQYLLSKKEAVLAFHTAQSRLIVWYIDREQIKVKLLPLAKQEVRRLVAEYLDAVQARNCPPELSRKMYDLILGQFREELAKMEQLIIIPDDYLFYLPWASLHDGEGYLLEGKKLLFAPSFTYVDRCYSKRNLNRINLLGVAPRDSVAELKIAARQVAGRPTLLKGEMPEGEFKQALSSSGVYHLGTGFHFYASDPFKSYFRLSRQGEEDGKFRLNEFFAQEMRANLLLLSASSFLEQELSAGNEFFTLVSALTFAGTPSLVYSLWQLDGMQRRKLLAEFYQRQSGEDFLDALRGAQLAMIKKYPQPYYWAGFQLCGFTGMGEKRALKFARKEVKRAGEKAVELAANKELKQALYYFQLQAELAKQVRDINMTVQGLQGVVNLGNKLEDFEAAIKAQLKLNELYGGSGQAQLVYLGGDNLAFLYQRAGLLEKAERQYLKNLEMLDAADAAERLKIYRALVTVGQGLGERGKARSYQQQAIALARRSGQTALAAELLIGLAQLRLQDEDYLGAIDSVKPAIEYFTDQPAGVADLARAYIRLGVAYTSLADYDQALEACAEGVRLAVATGISRLESEARLKAANAHLLSGDYAAARRQGAASLELARRDGNRILELQNYNLEGLFYLNLNDPQQALSSFERALEVARETDDKREQAAMYNNLGLAYRMQGGQEARALEMFRRALVLDEGLGAKRGQGHDHRNIGISLEKLGRLKEARVSQARALALAELAGDKRLIARAAAGLSSLSYEAGRYKEAVGYSRRALRVAAAAGLAEEHWQILRGLGRCQDKLGRLAEAMASYRQAVEIVEGMRAKLKVEEFKTGFLANKLDLYRDLIDLSLRAGRAEEALDYLERGKSRNFLDLLGNRKLKLKDLGSRELLEEERGLRNRMEMLAVQLTRATADERRTLEGQLAKFREDYGALMLKIKQGNPELAAMVSVDPAATAEIRALMDEGTAFLEYFLEQERILIFVVRPEGTSCRAVPFDLEKFREEVRAYRAGMEKMEPVEARQKMFYELLIAPVQERLQGVKILGLVPHDVLHYLSFAPIGKAGEQLVDRYQIFYAPSLNVFKFCLEKQPAGSGVLAMGNPDLNNPVFDLPYAALEIESIAMTESVEPYLRAAASEWRFKRKAGNFRRLHFACHGEFDAKNPLFSGLLMSPGEGEDGRLEAHEIFELDLASDLVTLSACQTGLGKLLSGDEIIGLNRAFITAGASAVVSSLWRVNDLTTALMIKRFYRYLPQEENKAAALRRAQLDVRKRYPHPGYWAAFRLTGYYK